MSAAEQTRQPTEGAYVMSDNRRQRQGLFMLVGLLLLFSISCTHQATSGTYSMSNLSTFEQSVFKELNRARTNPADYAAFLENTKARYDTMSLKIPGEERHQPDDFLRPFYEAIEVMKATTPLPPLKLSGGLSATARDHLHDQGQGDKVSHTGKDGSTLTDRAARYGSWEGGLGENIALGSGTPQRLAMQLIIDQNNPGRDYRLNILNPAFTVAGIACGNSVAHGNLCIITFAGKYVEKTTGTP
jgi:uncharacterized protein YkwD